MWHTHFPVWHNFLTLGLSPGAQWQRIYLQCRSHMRCGLIPGLGRFPGGGHGNPLQYFCLENPVDREASRATVHRVTKSQTWLKQQHGLAFASSWMILLDVVLSHWEFLLSILNKNAYPMNALSLNVTEFLEGKKKKKQKNKNWLWPC